MELMMVVSEMGEAWSPKIPPDMTAAMTRGMCKSIVAPKAKPIGIMMEKVPQLVPVENAVILATMKMSRGTRAGLMFPESKWARYLAVPRSPMTFPMKMANIKMSITGIISPRPSKKPLKYAL